jgi:hypothetical protein
VLSNRGILISKPSQCNHVMNKNQRNYVKDIEMSYKPFLDILGMYWACQLAETWSYLVAIG